MSQLDQLSSFIKTHIPARYMQEFDCWADDMELVRAKKALGLGQRRLGVVKSTGVLSWDRFPFRELDPQVVFGLILIWLDLQEYDACFTLDEPMIDPVPIDSKTVDLTIRVQLLDEIIVRPDPGGLLPIKGEMFSICSPEILTAEEATVIGAASD